jgi:hypothetical protein
MASQEMMQRKVWTGDEPEMRFPKSAIFWKKITPKRVFGVGLPYRSLQVKGFASSPDHSRSEHQLGFGRYGLTMQSAPGGARDLISPGQDLRSGITPTMLN